MLTTSLTPEQICHVSAAMIHFISGKNRELNELKLARYRADDYRRARIDRQIDTIDGEIFECKQTFYAITGLRYASDMHTCIA